jgi:hypothetical protein
MNAMSLDSKSARFLLFFWISVKIFPTRRDMSTPEKSSVPLSICPDDVPHPSSSSSSHIQPTPQFTLASLGNSTSTTTSNS